MKKIFRILLWIIFAASTFQGFAYDVKVDDICYNINQTEKTAAVTWNLFYYKGDIIIPSTINYRGEQYTVTEIERNAFRGSSEMVSIVIPESITEIVAESFYDCSSLVTIEFPKTLTKIGAKAFEGCNSLSYIELPDSYTEIGNYVFYGCSGLFSISLPSTLTKIGDFAFYQCNKLVYIDMPDSLTEIGECAFWNCNLLINKLPESLKKIGKQAFWRSLKNESIFIPASIESIGPAALYSEELAEIYVSQDNSYFASDNGILFNKDLTTLLFCPQGKSGVVTIPDSVEEIYGDRDSGLDSSMDIAGAFSQCKKITSVIFGKNVKSIGYDGFAFCTNLSKVSFNENLVSIDALAFYNCVSLSSIMLPNSLTFLGSRAFENCRKLIDVTLPNNLPSINNYTFRDCQSLKGIILPDSLKYIRDSAFSYCLSLPSILLPKNVESIEKDAFEGCTSIRVVVSLNPTPPSLNYSAFEDTSIFNTAELQVPGYAIEDYQKAAVWSNFTKITPLEIDEILPEGIIITGIPEGPVRPSESIQLSAQILPEDAFSQSVVWSSSNTGVASVTQDGFVIAISPGTTTITVYMEDYPEISASCEIIVSSNIIEAEQLILNVEEAELNKGETLQLSVIVLPENATDKTIIWESSNPSVASVSETGLVEAVSEGNCLIYAICGNLTVSCNVSVSLMTNIENIFGNKEGDISIYSIDGFIIKKNCNIEDLKNLSKGVYIIVSGKQRYKISI